MKSFISRKNKVVLMDNGNIQKSFTSSAACDCEERTLALLQGQLAPKLISRINNTLELTFVEGETLLDKYLACNKNEAQNLAKSLSETVNSFYRLSGGHITFDENFRNYLITDCGDCVRVDYEETTVGTKEDYLAKILAFAALYSVSEDVKLAFIGELINKLNTNKAVLATKFRKELAFLADRWKAPFPEKLYLSLLTFFN